MGLNAAASAEARILSLNSRGFGSPMTASVETWLEPYEPALRRLVPALIIAFLMALGAGAVLQIYNGRADALDDARAEIGLIASTMDDELNFRAAEPGADPAVMAQTILDLANSRVIAHMRHILVVDTGGRIIAGLNSGARSVWIGQPLTAIIGADAETRLRAQGTQRAVDLVSADAIDYLAHARPLHHPYGRLVVLHKRSDALAVWFRSAVLTGTLFTTTGLLLLVVGLGFHLQTARAAHADQINQNARMTIDAALESGRCGLWDWEIGSGRMYWSASMFEMLGMAHRDGFIDFDELSPLLHPDDTEVPLIGAEISAMERPGVDLQFRMRHARGRWVWLRARGRRLDVGGAPFPRFVGIVVDVTEQMDLAERSARADLRIREAIETISEAFVVCDEQERIVVSNTKFRELNGVPDGEALAGRCYNEALASGGGMRIAAAKVVGHDHSAGARSLEVHLEDGRWLQISERRTRCGGFVSVGTDITALKQHEAELKASEQQLMATVADLKESQKALEIQTQQLADLAEKYSEQKNRAEAANHAKSEFLANMSHELRTPLNAIIGFSEIMKETHFGPLGAQKYVEYAHDIHDSGHFLLSLIDDILDMSRIEAGRLKLEAQPTNLDVTIEEAMRALDKAARDKTIAISADVPDDVRIVADRRAIKQVTLNLLSNAVKFTPPGGAVSIKVRKTRGVVSLVISDTGIGIPKRALGNIGRPFEQVESAFSRNQKGTGLGLAIARSLCELHGGSLIIRSEEGVGTTVTVRLPAEGPGCQQPRAA